MSGSGSGLITAYFRPIKKSTSEVDNGSKPKQPKRKRSSIEEVPSKKRRKEEKDKDKEKEKEKDKEKEKEKEKDKEKEKEKEKDKEGKEKEKDNKRKGIKEKGKLDKGKEKENKEKEIKEKGLKSKGRVKEEESHSLEESSLLQKSKEKKKPAKKEAQLSPKEKKQHDKENQNEISQSKQKSSKKHKVKRSLEISELSIEDSESTISTISNISNISAKRDNSLSKSDKKVKPTTQSTTKSPEKDEAVKSIQIPKDFVLKKSPSPKSKKKSKELPISLSEDKSKARKKNSDQTKSERASLEISLKTDKSLEESKTDKSEKKKSRKKSLENEKSLEESTKSTKDMSIAEDTLEKSEISLKESKKSPKGKKKKKESPREKSKATHKIPKSEMAAEMLKDCEWESASEELVVSKKPLKSIPLLDLTNSPDSKPRKPPNSIENDEVIARILQESLNQESKDTAPPPLKPSETFKTPLVISPKKPSTAFSNQPAYRKVDMSKLSLIEGKLLYAYKPEDLDLRPSTGFKESMQNKARAPPLAGTREIPYGDPSCLSGKTFLVTGNLDFMDRAQAVEIIKKHGGKVAENVTKQVNICLAGNGFGPAKIKTIIERKLPILTEEGLFEYLQSTIVGKEIVNKPAPPKKIDITFTSNEDTSTYLWTDKYQPKRICDLIGNTQSVAAIVEWLKNWNKNTKVIVPETKGKAAKSSFQKALLLSGPPGIGKSSSIKTIANELGFNVIETNASDKRSKLSVMDFLKEVSQSNGIQSLLKSDKKDHFTKSLLIMDEVDGMSTGDKGGNKELCLAIPTAKIPIICICNDREKDSIKTLSKHCQDIRFTKPLPQQILPRIKSILDVEGQKLTDSQINQVLESCNGDIRQVLNLLQMWHTKSTSALGEQISKTKKDLDLGAFEIVPKFFTPKLSISAKLDFYFMDSYFLPLHVQDVYIDCGDNNIDKISRAADSLSEGDLIGKAIHRDQDYELMPLEALLTCIRPPILSGTVGFRGFIKIPTWFGKNSKQNKLKKYVQTLHSHIAPRTMADVTSTLDYLPLLSKHLTQPLSNGQEGVQQIISFMEFHDMDKEDRDNILEILEFGADPLESVSAQQKSSFTRLWNKEHFDFRQVNQKGKAIKSADKSDTSETERSTKQRKKEPKAAPKKRKAAAPKEPKKPRKAASKK